MKSIRRHSKDISDIRLDQLDNRKLKPFQVRVKVQAAPINPSDQLHALGYYGRPDKMKPPPHFIGGQGAGNVVECGDKVSKQTFMGKRVSFLCDPHQNSGGSWSQYVILNTKRIDSQFTLIPDKISSLQAASFFVNPLTTLAMWDIAKKSTRSRAIIHNAAASALGKMLLRFSVKMNIPVICIVRRIQQVEDLKALGGKYIVNTSDKDWGVQLRKLAKMLDARIMFDAVGGRDTGKCLSLMPPNSQIYNYGVLSGKSIGTVSETDLIMYNKKIHGLWLPIWMKSLNPLEIQFYLEFIKKDFEENGGKIFGTKCLKEFSLDQWQEAIQYQLENASKGKSYFRPHL